MGELKQVTGAQDVSSMVSKFIDQKTNRKNLEKEKSDAEQKLAKLKKNYSAMEKSYQELKTTGAGQVEFGREHMKQIEGDIEKKKAKLKLQTATAERTKNVMIGLQQGAKGLLQRASVYNYLLREPGVFDLTSGNSPNNTLLEDASWSDTLDALNLSEQICAKLMEINASVGEAGPNKTFDEDDQSLQSSVHSLETAVEAPSHALNVRIKSKKMLRDEEIRMTRGGDENAPAPSQMASTVMQLLASGAADSPVRAGMDSEDEDDEQSSGMLPTKKKNFFGEEAESAPRREVVKMMSVNKVQEAHRREDMEIRKKALAERLASRNTADVDDAEGIANAARLTAQRESTKKLSTFPQPPTLPTGTTLRDDAMTKTRAFLSFRPDLI